MKTGVSAAIFGLFVIAGFSQNQDVVQPKLQYEVNVTKKLVQVYVLDKRGNAVADLAMADFELYDDGRLQTITDFERHELLTLTSVSPALAPAPAVRPKPAAPLSRKFFFFFDFTFNTAAGIAKSRRAALDFLKNQVRPEDQVGILSFATRKGLTLHEYLTSDFSRIRNVVEGFASGRFRGRAAMMQGGPEEEIPEGNLPASERILAAEDDLIARSAIEFASQMTELAVALRRIPGIKNIIFFSAGIPNSLLFGNADIGDPQRGKLLLRDLFDEMGKGLASSSCAVYPVNVSGRGSATFGKSDVSFQVSEFGGGTDFERENRLGDAALKQLAEDSGGKYFDNINRYEDANKTIQKTTGTFYVLGYDLEEKLDGCFHDVRVAVKRKGCSVFGQRGYFNPKPFSEYSENEKSLHVMDLALADNPMLQAAAEVPLIALPIVENEKPAVVAVLGLPADLASKILAGTAEAVGLVFDEKGGADSSARSTLTISRSNDTDAQVVIVIPASPGRLFCRAALCNMKTGEGVRGSGTVVVPEAGDSALRLDPILFLTEWRPEDIYASPGTALEDLYGFDAMEYSVLTGDFPAGVETLPAAVRVAFIEPGTEIEWIARLKGPDGEEAVSIPVAVLRETTDGSTKKLCLEFATGKLTPGVYSLFLNAREKNGFRVAGATATFTVK